MVVAYRPGHGSPLWRGAFWDVGWLADDIAGFAFVAWIAVVAVATLGHRALSRWMAWMGVPVALINLVGVFAVKARTGAPSPHGWFALVVGGSFACGLSPFPWRPGDRPALEQEQGGVASGAGTARRQV